MTAQLFARAHARALSTPDHLGFCSASHEKEGGLECHIELSDCGEKRLFEGAQGPRGLRWQTCHQDSLG
jgi:hypothetical protein